MILWGAMLIPIVTVLILAIGYSKKLLWWEYLVILGTVPLLIWGAQATIEYNMTTATEMMGGYINHVEYHEYWKEWEHETCTQEYACGTDSEGNTEYCTEIYDCSHYEDHPEYWEAFDSNKASWSITKETFDSFVKLFGNKTFVNLDHSNHYDMTRSECVDGNEYDTNLPNPYTDNQIESTTVTHSYTNKVQASHSVFNFPTIDPKKTFVYNRPPIDGWHQDAIIGEAGPTKKEGERQLGIVNGILGHPSKVHVYVLVFHDKPRQSFIDQQAYWKNGNKNELNACVGVDKDYNIQWCDVFGWSKLEGLKFTMRDHIIDQKVLNLEEFGKWLYPQIQGKQIRRDMKEFDYLQVDPPTWAVILVYFLVLALCGFIAWFEVNSDLAEQQRDY